MFSEIKSLIRFDDPNSQLENLNGFFQVRVGHLPLSRIGVRTKFTMEGGSIFDSIESSRPPALITIGQDAYVKSKDMQERYFPIGMIHSNSLQFIKLGEKIDMNKPVRIVRDVGGAEWSRKQDLFMQRLGAEPKTMDVKGYAEVGKALVNEEVDLAVVPAPVNFLAGSYGYSTLTIDDDIFTNALLLVRKDIAREILP